jgi:hypothetical protein
VRALRSAPLKEITDLYDTASRRRDESGATNAESDTGGRRPAQLNLAPHPTTPGLSLIGLPELIGWPAPRLIALLTVFAYFYFICLRSRDLDVQRERDELQAALRSSEKGLETNKSVRGKSR